jgi:ketosteroid isomerase-like protein
MTVNIMRTNQMIRGTVAVSIAIMMGGCGERPSAQQGSELAGEVTSRWSKAFDAGDPAALAALYAENARSLPPSTAPIVGRADIESYWRGDIGEGGATTKIAVTDATMQGDVLHVEGTYDVMGKNNAELATGQFQQLWTQTGGDWQLLREMWRMDPKLMRSTDVAEGLTSEWTKAYNASDAKALVALYDKDAVISTVQEGSFSDPASIEAFWARDFGDSKPSSTLTLTDVYISGELAHLEGEYKVLDRGTVTEGRYVQLWMRDGNAWRVHREMWLR